MAKKDERRPMQKAEEREKIGQQLLQMGTAGEEQRQPEVMPRIENAGMMQQAARQQMQPQPMEQMMPGERQYADPPILQSSGVRSAEAEQAFQQGQRDGAIAEMERAGIQPLMRKTQGMHNNQTQMTKERINKAMQTLLEYKAGKDSVEKRIIHAQEWWKMHNWEEIERKRGTKGASTNKGSTGWLWNAIVGKHADAIDSYPEPVILPRMEDDKQEASMLSDIVPIVMEMNGFEETYSLCQWQKMLEGTAGYGVFWDKSKMGGMGDIAIRKISLLNLFWEPGITDIQESQNVYYVTMIDNTRLEEQYPQLIGKLKGKGITLAKYKSDDNVSYEDKSPVIDWYYHKWIGGKKILHYCKFVGEEILYSTEQNGIERGLYDDGQYPFVLDPLFPVEGSPAGYGYIDIGRDIQSDIDTINQAMVRNAVVNSTPRYFIRKDGSINEDEFADWSKPFIHTGGQLGDDAIKAVQSAKMDSICMNLLERKIDELKFVTGNQDVNNGGTPTGVTAASAIAALKEDAGRSSKDSSKSAYRSYRKIVNMVIERIRQFYDIPRQFRIMGEMNQEKFVEYSNSGITQQLMAGGLGMEDGYRLPTFDIEVHAQRENAYTKMSQNELALQFFQLGFFNPQITDQALMAMDMMDFKGKDELAKKIQDMGTMQQSFMQVSQIAVALAQKYDPAMAQQLVGIIQGVTGESQAMPSGGKEKIDTESFAEPGDSAKATAMANENPIVTRARERVMEATRPD